jgi:predicted HTH transcriptional regulator
MADIEEIGELLQSGDFESLVGIIEDGKIEAKGSPYQLSLDRQKQELAKDVSALGNARGGMILIGFETTKDGLNALERVVASRPFAQELVDTEQYRDVLQDWVAPPIHGVRIEWYPSSLDPTKGVAAIEVPPEATNEKPYIVRKVVDQDGRVRGTLVDTTRGCWIEYRKPPPKDCAVG